MTAAVLAGLSAPAAFAVAPAASANSSSGASTDIGSEEATSEARAAAEEAADTGERVEILGKRTEYATTFANPDGVTFSLSQSAVPVRVEQSDGSWAEPDATLERRADGSIGPKAAVAEVSFSAGGAGADLVTVAEGERSLKVGWPGELPEPVLDGASAVYADVLPGVDLRMTATTEGYRQVLVVKTAEAAASDELEKLDFPVEAQGLTLRGGVGGGLNAVDENGNAVFRTPAARQWDSAGDAAESGTTTMSLTASDSTGAANDAPVHDGDFTPDPAEGPSDGDASAVLPVTADNDSITVVPDAELLTGADTVYPLYIDPDVSWGGSERTLLSSDGDTFYNFSGGDDGEGVGYCGTYVTGGIGYYCGSGYRQRMYFEFAPTALRGKRVLGATFRVTERFSMSCEKTTVQLVRTPNISSATNWPGPTSNWDILGDRTVSAGRGEACTPSQPDAPIEFKDDPDQSYENLTHTVKVFAEGGFSRLTLMLKAYNESDPNGWKRFDDDAVLDVTYVGLPGVPTSPTVGTSCETNSADPAWLSNPKPKFGGVVQTASGGEYDAHLRAHFYVQEKQSDGTWGPDAVTEPVRPPAPGYVVDGTKVTEDSPITLKQNTPYRMAVFSRSYYNSGANHIESNSTVKTKGWCYFTIDSTRPKAPTITAPTGALYEVCPDEGDGCGAATGGPGKAGQFVFTKNTADNNIVAFEYKLATDTKWTKVSGTSSVTRSVKPALSGVQVLYVRAVDSVGTGQSGEATAIRFNVAESQGASARWHFNDSPVNSGETTASDSATTDGARHPATLYNTGAGWSALGRRGSEDRSLVLNDNSDTTRQTGYAATAGPAVNTQSSYTVSAWANLTDDSVYRGVMSQTGTDSSGFVLYYSAGVKQWVFRFNWTDNTGRHFVTKNSTAVGVPLKVWTHLAAVYDADAATIQLYVNGRVQGAPVAVPAGGEIQTPDSALQVGRASYEYGAYTQYWKGRIDEAAVFQEALQPSDVAKEAKLLDSTGTGTATELMAAWNGNALTDTLTGYGRSLALSGGAALDGESIVLDGTNDAATVTGPVVDDTGSFTVTTEIELDRTALSTKATGYVGQVLGQRTADGSAWGLWYQQTGTETWFDDDGNLHEDPAGYWKFGRLNSDGSFDAVTSDSAAVTGAVRLTGVYDAQDGTIRLYLDSTRNDVETVYTAQAGTGELAVGKGYVAGAWGHYLPGRVNDIRIWVGAAADGDQVDTMIG
ncbi:LamG domain-containing protein [Streptomyces sp. NPDC002680]|uniref:LamG domain-containing protein n=1 Tax=Streptomyces sp. NPDC002680 TaxID=3364659 RepID=UPI00367DE623